MRSKTFKILILSILAITITAPFAAADATAKSGKSSEKDYTIGAGDVLEVVTWKEPDFSREQVLVRIDGKITFLESEGDNVVGVTGIGDLVEIIDFHEGVEDIGRQNCQAGYGHLYVLEMTVAELSFEDLVGECQSGRFAADRAIAYASEGIFALKELSVKAGQFTCLMSGVRFLHGFSNQQSTLLRYQTEAPPEEKSPGGGTIRQYRTRDYTQPRSRQALATRPTAII